MEPDTNKLWVDVWVALQELGSALSAFPDSALCPPEVGILMDAVEDSHDVITQLALKGDTDTR